MAGKSLNKVMLIGNLGKDADLRYTPSGLAVATFSMATNERFKPSGSDEWQDKTEWHNIVIWGKTAENVGEYLLKGQKVYVEGRLQTRSWEGQDGNKRYTTEIVVRDIILLGGRGESSSHGQFPPHPADTYSASPQPTHTGASAPGNTGFSAPTHTGSASANQDIPPANTDETAPPDEEIPF